MPARHRDFGYTGLPDFIYWDTSFIGGLYLNFLPTYRRHNHQCLAFVNRIFASDVISVTSDWCLNESVHLVIQNRLQRETNAYNAQHHSNLSTEQFKQQNPSIIKDFLSEINNVRQTIENVCEILLPEVHVTDRAFDIINNYYIRPTDAYHIATAQSYGITSFAAIDRDFLRVDGIEVFTCLPS